MKFRILMIIAFTLVMASCGQTKKSDCKVDCKDSLKCKVDSTKVAVDSTAVVDTLKK
jgi:hypothetical protein